LQKFQAGLVDFSAVMLYNKVTEKERQAKIMTIGSQIQKLRTEKGLTQERFAEFMEVSRQSVSKWELGVSHS